MISVSQALAILLDHVPSMSAETVGLEDALGRIMAHDVRAGVARPPQDVSAMDGYAVRLDDVRRAGVTLKIIGEVPAGSVFQGQVGQGEAVRLFTGSPIPKGADHIVIQENTVRNGDAVKIETASPKSQYIRRAGIDFKVGDILVPRLAEMGPFEVALAAAGNASKLSVLTKPRIAILAAGDELVPPGTAALPGDVVNSNTATLSALITTWGGTAEDMGLVKDDPAAIKAMFERARGSDIILPVGGASVGDHDHMRRVFTEMGGQMLFERVAIKPGKPTWFGLLDGTPVLGLPGNPASAIVCAHLFLRRLMGRPAPANIKATLEIDVPENGPRETYLRAHVICRDGRLYVTPLSHQDSSLLTPFASANGLLQRLPNANFMNAGDLADVIDLGAGTGLISRG